MIILLIGLPGSGKTTQAKILAKKLKLKHVSFGQILRTSQENGTILGNLSKKYTDKGKLLPSELFNFFLKSVFKGIDFKKGFVLDGVPRSLNDAKILDEIFEENSCVIDKIFILNVSEKTVQERIKERAKIELRADDKRECIQKRIKEFKDEIDSIRLFYKGKNIIEEINADESIEEVSEKILKKLQY